MASLAADASARDDEEEYDAEANSYDSWQLAISSMREKGVRLGQFTAKDDAERRWAEQGPVSVADLDSVVGGVTWPA